jgi:predicted DNA-binding transcriptional regulator AlpA
MTAAMVPSQPDPRATGTPPGGGALITMKEIRAKFRLGRTAGYELVRRPDFPARIVISTRCHRWLETEVNAFAEALRDHPVPRRVTASQRAQPAGPTTALRLAGKEHPVRARKESR